MGAMGGFGSEVPAPHLWPPKGSGRGSCGQSHACLPVTQSPVGPCKADGREGLTPLMGECVTSLGAGSQVWGSLAQGGAYSNSGSPPRT